MQHTELLENLAYLGLDETESRVFLEISKPEPHTAVKLARSLGIPKTTLYRYLDSLTAKGFVIVTLSSRGREYSPSKNVFELKLNEAKLRFTKLQEMKPALEIALFTPSTIAGANTRVYNGIDGAKQILWNLLSAKSVIYYYTNANRKELFGEKWYTAFCMEFVHRKKYEMGFESNQNTSIDPEKFFAIAPGYLDRSEYILLKDVDYNGEAHIFDNIYSYFSWDNGQFFGIEIENAAFAETQKKIFVNFWNMVITSKQYVSKHEKSGPIT
ncbi:hypothetical protein CO112_02625 [Candidatus Dojkabacteria bacterium CG_4_9_14_3_um_filter_150_Dojkabacteria_WS6_41_13]|uniref:Transcription regulator TrmB N-terminal domain-containing protein n=1 Tax=Candidatus Dojkabacteria bacterium CG_4_10_14_0_2_um_filter_Dojkabacteria_WS6_41_15 TaxID=2014249 RepID=A0A2M7W1B9_9BACT|nr:MAG: hypothetical protein COZ14_02190 [Candidatus Dojkabacteria bacterium CG_4_10_14_3_um_filter_Dojkabacteria_WS6_41_9]PJA13085.1 MAG: hypothetical protein COX64_03705 [Candidatus Dojkabacteria bacterium CG_4_10_14_0_2_um_filter_Dojkabacteria_WS6_41_15]PJB22779.1 MAG: hypothetical protein CO112_02625 [Candidatus Dojkabacteria bacterium CG_4_9_14_3_um_filter_150_Dojkabacteria_WS6_41_13]